MKELIGSFIILAVISSGYGQEQKVQFDQPIEADQYLIRPGDELTVTFLKANIEPLELTVDSEGRIIHGNLGLFDLSHRTLSQAREELTEALRNLFKIENIIISIDKPLSVGFSVIGAVGSPGFYQGYNSQRVSDAIERAGGILSDGSTRRIVLSGGPDELPVDLDLAEFTGVMKSNPCLYAGYLIHVPQKSGERVQVIGEVNNPREIELQNGDDLNLLLSLAGGLRSWADSGNIQIIRDGNSLNAGGETILSGDIIRVNSLANIPEFNNVAIFGAVLKPGKYQPIGTMSLSDIVKLSGGFDSKAVKARITVFRFRPIDAVGRLSTQRFPIQNVANDETFANEFKLAPGDSVFVPYFAGYVEVTGLVSNPGSFPYYADKSAEFYVNLAGGYLPDAERTKLEIYDAISRMSAQLSPKVIVQDGSKITVSIRRELK